MPASAGAAVLAGLVVLGACGFELPPLNTSSVGNEAGAGGVDGSAGTGVGANAGVGGSAGTAGVGGSAGTAGVGGSAGTAGVGGSAGTAGVGGSAGAAGVGGSAGAGQAPWWDARWRTRWPIRVVNESDEPLDVGFQIPLPIDEGSGPKTPVASWRVAWWDGSSWTDVPRVVERVGEKWWVWFAAQDPITNSLMQDGYYLYCDNPNADEPAFASSVFTFHAFFGAEDSTNWSATGTVTHAEGQVELSGADGGSSIRSLVLFRSGYGVDIAMTVVMPAVGRDPLLGCGFHRANDFDKKKPFAMWASRNELRINTEYANDNVFADWVGVGLPLELNVEHIYSIARHPTSVDYAYDLEAYQTYAWESALVDTNSLQVRINAYKNSFVKARFARVRRVSNPAPSSTLGPMESHL
ncbi:MAG: hypothetical protein MUF54_16650 [Polyangiaceae bacterium]|nr:hypothetical protein [Polyangiaceae bacterium]